MMIIRIVSTVMVLISHTTSMIVVGIMMVKISIRLRTRKRRMMTKTGKNMTIEMGHKRFRLWIKPEKDSMGAGFESPMLQEWDIDEIIRIGLR